MTGKKSPFAFTEAGAVQTLLQSILSSVPDAMIVINRSGEILAFSSAAEVLFGHAAEDVLGQSVNMLMTGTDDKHHDQYVDSYLATGRRADHRDWTHRPSAQGKWGGVPCHAEDRRGQN